jgi:hypothetical protein
MVGMSEQSTHTTQTSQAASKPWSDAELRRISRVLDLLSRVDKRVKEKSHEETEKENVPDVRGVQKGL